MIEATYSARKESGNMARLLGDLERECSILRQHALVGLSRGTKVNREEWVPTRFGERQFVDVLLLKKYVYDTKREEATLSFAGEDTPLVIPRNSRVLSLDLRKSVSVRLMKQMVRVPVEMAPPPVARKHLVGLEEYLYLGDERLEEPSLRLGIIDSSDEVREGCGGTQNPKYRIFYDSRMGYFTKKK